MLAARIPSSLIRLTLAAGLVAGFTATATAAPVTVYVKCGVDTIQGALATPADELVIEFDGLCVENVVILRDFVTLRGRSRASSIIESPGSDDPRDAAVMVRGARVVRLESLQLRGGLSNGLRILGAHDQIAAEDLLITGNDSYGLAVIDSSLSMSSSEISGNYRGLIAAQGSVVDCSGCKLAHDPASASNLLAVAFRHSSLTLRDGSSLSGSSIPLIAQDHSTIEISESGVSADLIALWVEGQSRAAVNLAKIEGSIHALDRSSADLAGTVQTANPIGNMIDGSSNLNTAARSNGAAIIESELTGGTTFSRFSNGSFSNASQVGTLTCNQGSNAWCSPATSYGVSTCGLCP